MFIIMFCTQVHVLPLLYVLCKQIIMFFHVNIINFTLKFMVFVVMFKFSSYLSFD